MARLDPAFYQEQAFRCGARHPTLHHIPYTLSYPRPAPLQDKLMYPPLTLVHQRAHAACCTPDGCCAQAVLYVSQAPPACREPAGCYLRARVRPPAMPARLDGPWQRGYDVGGPTGDAGWVARARSPRWLAATPTASPPRPRTGRSWRPTATRALRRTLSPNASSSRSAPCTRCSCLPARARGPPAAHLPPALRLHSPAEPPCRTAALASWLVSSGYQRYLHRCLTPTLNLT